MRDKFKDTSQGRRMIKDYIRYLESLAARVPDLNKFDIVQQLVKKSSPYLQLKWAEAGFTEDFTSLEEYEESGYRFEQAEELRIYLEKKLAREKTQPESQFRRNDRQGMCREEYPRPTQLQNKQNTRHDSRRTRPWEENTRTQSPNFKNYTPRENPRNHYRDNTHLNRATRTSTYQEPGLRPEERDILRANNQCFTCREKGHLSKDCPKKNTI
ncbi:hypothetical protein M422DRAFT_261747 [Sphaerobolus stellatus SS14]|uniref:CCHC-type domain-containing protein n=1 Tax=Sphaerobolus stellatus (strain SS14) TaxID=990650 RepID=A0A0C9UMC1_SPHS4|nr:hypothetical protein M422DRAFT_261747 [Sphaerobolus stellatus SS14]